MRLRRWLDRLVLAGALAFVWIQSERYRFVLDDAFISLRYARNLARGEGLVFNPGLPPVEGYTNFLWVLIEAAHIPFTPWPEHALLVYNALFGLLVVVAVWREMALRGPAASAWTWLAVSLVAAHETLHAWMGGGLETTFFMLLVTVGVGRFLREQFHGESGAWSAIPLGLAALTRPEAYLVLGVCVLAVAVRGLRDAARRRYAALWLLGVCAACLPHLAFRRVYYGEWVPNTFFAKISGPYLSSGLPYLEIFSSAFYGTWLVLAGIVLWGFVAAIRRRGEFALDRGVLGLAVAGWFGYIAYAGGDHFEFRLLAPTVPLLALLSALTASDFSSRRPEGARSMGWRDALAAAGGLALILRMVLSEQHPAYADELFHRLRIPSAASLARANYAERWRPAGEWLRRFAKSDERISVPAAGVIPWVSDLTTLDTHGLSDREIAHRPISVRGILAHEKSATWDDVVNFGVTLHVDDLEFRDRVETFPDGVLRNDSRILVELPTHQWMSIRAVGEAATLRSSLRSRGAIVAAGPNDDPRLVDVENSRNRPNFNAWCEVAERARQARLRASLIPLSSAAAF